MAEIFDLTGKVTPITATMKMDLHTLVEKGLNWDNAIPDALRPIWSSHFEMIQEIGKLKFKTMQSIWRSTQQIQLMQVKFGMCNNICKISKVRWNIFLPASLFFDQKSSQMD